MKKISFLIFLSICCYNISIVAQVKKKAIDTCKTGLYWFEGNSEKVHKDSVAITAYIKVVHSVISPSPAFSRILINKKEVFVNNDGMAYLKVPKGEYIISAKGGGFYWLTTDKIKLNGGGGITITFYVKGQILE
ncbi:MAG: hypothetical protein KA319_08240 [Ferruginibacter sp.]|nr:hypothetical protein [Ferruginibacter sp.]